MRYLHQVGKHERFVASGVYTQFRQAVPTGLVESWSIHEIGGAEFVRVDRDGRLTDGRSRLCEFLRTPEGAIERVDVWAYGSPDDVARLIRLSYTFYETRVEVLRVVDQGQPIETTLPLPAGYGMAMDISVLSGFVVARMSSQTGDSLPLFVPGDVFADSDTAASMVRQVNRPCLVGEEVVEIAHKSISARHLHWAVNSADFWLDSYDTLLQAQDCAGDRMALTQYARRPDPHV